MEILQLLGIAVGLASLAGLNLYLTVFVTGLAVRLDWISLTPEYQRLEVLADPWVLGVSGVLFAMEFAADKFPWVDSVWDAVHTAIRPLGAALLAVMVLGDGHPVFNTIVGLLAAWLGFTTHALKATVRLQANASPEPVTNVLLSLAGDATVILGIGLIFTHPIVALGIAVIALAAIWYFVPRMLRSTWVKLWLCGRKLRLAAVEPDVGKLPDDLPSRARAAMGTEAGGDAKIAWAVPCISGSGPGYPRNRFGWLARTEGPSPSLCFVPRRRPGRPRSLPPGTPAARVEQRFLADVLILEWPGGEKSARFLFDRGARTLARRVAEAFEIP